MGLLGMHMTGGNINSNTPEIYEKYVGDDYEDDWEKLNFNDMQNAFITLYQMQHGNVGDSWEKVMSATALYPTQFHKLYCDFFRFFINLIIANIFIGFFIDIVTSYFDKTYKPMLDAHNKLESKMISWMRKNKDKVKTIVDLDDPEMLKFLYRE